MAVLKGDCILLQKELIALQWPQTKPRRGQRSGAVPDQNGGQFFPNWRPIFFPILEANFRKARGQFFLPKIGLRESLINPRNAKLSAKTVCQIARPIFRPNGPAGAVRFFGRFFLAPKTPELFDTSPPKKLAEKSASKSAVGGRVSGPGFQLQFWILGGRRSRLVCRGW